MTVRDNTIAAKGLGDFFRRLGKKGPTVSKRMAKKRIKENGTSFADWY